MRFHLEERRAWVRTSTHTVILDRDERFERFAGDPSGTPGEVDPDLARVGVGRAATLSRRRLPGARWLPAP